MKHLGLAAALAFACTGSAHAGIYSDDMARCLVSSTTTSDKTLLVKWVFAVASLHPEVASLSALTAEQREALDKSVGALFERLLTEDCRKQAQDAVRYEGAASFRSSFEVLGQVAMQELNANPAVGRGFTGFIRYVDEQKIKALAPR